MRECEAYVEQISGLLDGTLTPEERAGLDAHLSQCPACRSLVRDLQTMGEDLSAIAPVSDGFADRVMQAAAQQEQDAPEMQIVPQQKNTKKWRKPLLRIGALAACCVLVFGLGRFMLGFFRCGSAAPAAENNAAQQEAACDSVTPLEGTIRHKDSIYLRQEEVLSVLPESAACVGAVIRQDTDQPELVGCLLYEDSDRPDVIYVENPEGDYSCWTKES